MFICVCMLVSVQVLCVRFQTCADIVHMCVYVVFAFLYVVYMCVLIAYVLFVFVLLCLCC